MNDPRSARAPSSRPAASTARPAPAATSDPVQVLRRWEEFGAIWRVVSATHAGVTVSMCRCDGGEEVQRLTSADPAFVAYTAAADRTPPPV